MSSQWVQEEEVIYKCAVCGWPCRKSGAELRAVTDGESADAYFEKHADARVILLTGAACGCAPEEGEDEVYYHNLTVHV